MRLKRKFFKCCLKISRRDCRKKGTTHHGENPPVRQAEMGYGVKTGSAGNYMWFLDKARQDTAKSKNGYKAIPFRRLIQ